MPPPLSPLLLSGIFLAWNPDNPYSIIVSFALGRFRLSIWPPVLFSLFWKRTNLQGALAGNGSRRRDGFVWKSQVRPMGGTWNIYELLPAFVVSAHRQL